MPAPSLMREVKSNRSSSNSQIVRTGSLAKADSSIELSKVLFLDFVEWFKTIFLHVAQLYGMVVAENKLSLGGGSATG
jgi:hypothetical protein